MIYAIGDLQPQLATGAYVAPSASVIGAVVLEEGASVWFGAVLRGDSDQLVVGAGSNVQDLSVLHADPGFPLRIGRNVTVGHRVMLHGCTIGDGSLVGIGAIVLNGARIGRECLVGAGALVTENSEFPDGSLILGAPARVRRELSTEERAMLAAGAEHYRNNARRFEEHLRPL